MRNWKTTGRENYDFDTTKLGFMSISNTFISWTDKNINFVFVMGLQYSIKYDKVLKTYTFKKTYSMTLTFETMNVELAKDNVFNVSCRNYSNRKNIGKWRKF